MATAQHNISLRINDQVINRWQTYSITNDMLTPADGFELDLSPGTKDAYDLVPPDSLVEVRIDDNPVLTGRIEDRDLKIDRNGSMLSVVGRDKTARMVDESQDLGTFGKLSLKSIAEIVAAGEFDEVRLDNKLNRDLVRGRRSGKAPAGSEPLFAKSADAPKKVEIGETRWGILEHFLKPAELLAWSSADGKALILGLPNYSQLPQYRFFVPMPGSKRITEGNVKAIAYSDTVSNRYSTITIFGSSKGNRSNYGKRVLKNQFTVRQFPGPDGIGGDFRQRKQLFLADPDVSSIQDARDRAERELSFREGERLTVELTVAGHSQARLPGDIPALFAFDTMAELEIEGIASGQFLITSVIFSVNRDGGEQTQIKLVPKGTDLVS